MEQETTTKELHKSYLKASNLIYISAGLGITNLLLMREDLLQQTQATRIIGIISILFVFALGYLARQGYSWLKYLLLVLFILGLFSLPIFIANLIERTVIGIINIGQTVLQFWAMIILFKIPKNSVATNTNQLYK